MASNYEDLIHEIAQIYETALATGDSDWNKSILASNWKIGERIVEVEQDSNFRATYGDRIIQKLSESLKRKLGSGFSSRNLRYMRQFYLVYKNQKIDPRISWSHYREIVSIENAKERKRLENLIIEKGLSVRDLIQLRNQSLDSMNGIVEDPDNQGTDTGNYKGILRRPVLKLFTYRLEKKFSMNSAHSVPNLDLGFGIIYELGEDFDIRNFQSGALVSTRKYKNRFILEKKESVRELYTYKAYLDRVVDGDTLLVVLDLGFGIFFNKRLRLHGLDVPEIESQEGQRVKRFVQRELEGCEFLILKTHGSDLYDRYLADVFYLKNESNQDRIIEEGKFLNNVLLKEGLATRI